jgi:hypothetical protein
MTAAARPIEAATLVPSNHVHDLIRDKSELERDLKSARARNATLLKQLNLAVSAGKVQDTLVVDGLLTTVLTTGRVLQLQTKSIESRTEAGYRAEWVEIAPIPGTAAAYLAASKEEDARLALDMDVVAGDEEMAS